MPIFAASLPSVGLSSRLTLGVDSSTAVTGPSFWTMLDELALLSGILELLATGADEVHAASSALTAITAASTPTARTGIQDNAGGFIFML